MPVLAALLLAAAAATSATATPSEDPTAGTGVLDPSKTPTRVGEDPGLSAPLVSVDRFSDAAGTLLRRSRLPGLPGPNQPIDLDAAPFLVAVRVPGGATARCYNLDLRRADRLPRYYVFYDRLGNYELGQFPIVDVVPGDPGYSDVWDIWKVVVPDGFRPVNAIRDMAELRRLLDDPSSGYTEERTGALLNAAIVPEGSRASMKAERRDGATVRFFAWYRGKRAPYLYFDHHIRLRGDETAPVSTLRLSRVEDLVKGTAPGEVAAVPPEPSYSPLHRLVGPGGEALANDPLNCPLVGLP